MRNIFVSLALVMFLSIAEVSGGSNYIRDPIPMVQVVVARKKRRPAVRHNILMVSGR